MTTAEQEILLQGAAQIGVELSQQQRTWLVTFAAELELWNPRAGLVNAEGETLVRKHFLDSLAAVPVIRAELGLDTAGNNAASGSIPAADLGSGNGFPGIVLQIAIPELRMHLVERSAKRCGFLRNCAALLPDCPLTILQQELSECRDRYRLIVSRAFRPLHPDIANGMKNITDDDGIWMLYKGNHSTAETECKEAGLTARIVPLQVPGLTEQRCLVVHRP